MCLSIFSTVNSFHSNRTPKSMPNTVNDRNNLMLNLSCNPEAAVDDEKIMDFDYEPTMYDFEEADQQSLEETSSIQHNSIHVTASTQNIEHQQADTVNNVGYIVVDEIFLKSLFEKVNNLELEIKSLKRVTGENHIKTTEQLDKIYKVMIDENKQVEKSTCNDVSFDFPIENVEEMNELNNKIKLIPDTKNNLVNMNNFL